MKTSYLNINHSRYIRVWEWGKLISITGGAQIIVQAIGFVCGILIIRLLPPQEYAFYTLAYTMLGTMTVLADGGIANSVMAHGGKVWKDREKLGTVLVTGYDLRKKFAVGSLLLGIPILFYLLLHHEAGWLTAVLIIAAIIPTFFTALSGQILVIAPTLHQAIWPLQKLEIGFSLGRLILILFSLFFFPVAYLAVLAASIPQIWQNLRLRLITATYANWKQNPNAIIKKNILSVVKRILPGSIYYCLSGQITIWLISIFGTTLAVAQIGALGRLSMMLALLGSVFSTLVIPRFSRLKKNKPLLLKRFLQSLSALSFVCILIIGVVWLLPEKLLWILGDDYSHLQKELVLSIVGGCAGMVAGLLFTTATSRNWVLNPLISIPITLTAIISGIVLLDVSTLLGVLRFTLFVSSVEVIMYFSYCIIKIQQVKVIELE